MKKNANPGIDEVRAARMEVSLRYGHNIDRMLADHMKQQARYADRVITPRRTQLSEVRAYDALRESAHAQIAAGQCETLTSYRAARKRKTKGAK